MILALLVFPSVFAYYTPLLNGSDPKTGNFLATNLSGAFLELVGSWGPNVSRPQADGTRNIPWFSSSTACGVSNLQNGSNCNIGTVNFSNYCIVSDEQSQVTLAAAMAQNQTYFDELFKFQLVTNSSFGQIPAWRIVFNGTYYPCLAGVNANCDTASDATARFIIGNWYAANNTKFANATQRLAYASLALNLTDDMIANEIVYNCRNTSITGYDQICYWLKAGSQATLTGTDGAYTGYYGYAIKALLLSYANTGNTSYFSIAANLTLNYMQASYPVGTSYAVDGFRVPPGRSFRWDNFSATGAPGAFCTNTCSPDRWDSIDAPRAFVMCEVNRDAKVTLNQTLPLLDSYCASWTSRYMNTSNSVPIQYFPNGLNASSYQSGYFAQGLQSSALSGGHDVSLFNASIRSAIGHYQSATASYDSSACFGVYTEASSVVTLGQSIGLDKLAWGAFSQAPTGVAPVLQTYVTALTNNSANLTFVFDSGANLTFIGPSTFGSTAFNITNIVRLTGLTPNTTYTFNISFCSFDAFCSSNTSMTFRTLESELIPPAITTLTKQSAFNGANATITFNESTNLSVRGIANLNFAGFNTTYVLNFSNLTANTTYSLNLTFCDVIGNCATNTSTVSTLGTLPTVSVSSAVTNTTATVTLTFNRKSNLTVTEPVAFASASLNTTSVLSYTGLVPDTTYNLAFRFCDEYGLCDSAATTFTTSRTVTPTQCTLYNIVPTIILVSLFGAFGLFLYSMKGSGFDVMTFVLFLAGVVIVIGVAVAVANGLIPAGC